MADTFTNFFNNSQTFGLNIKVPEKTLQQVGQTASSAAAGVFEPLFSYLEENENIFSGDINTEINKIRSNAFNTTMIMDAADEQINGTKPSFDTKF